MPTELTAAENELAIAIAGFPAHLLELYAEQTSMASPYLASVAIRVACLRELENRKPGIESVPISSAVQERVHAILKERGFPEYQDDAELTRREAQRAAVEIINEAKGK